MKKNVNLPYKVFLFIPLICISPHRRGMVCRKFHCLGSAGLGGRVRLATGSDIALNRRFDVVQSTVTPKTLQGSYSLSSRNGNGPVLDWIWQQSFGLQRCATVLKNASMQSCYLEKEEQLILTSNGQQSLADLP